MKKKGGKGKPKSTGIVAKKPASVVPGTDRGQFSKMPAGPSVGMKAKGPMVARPAARSMVKAALEKKLKGVRI